MIYFFCIEASFQRGLGHLYRSLNLAKALKKNVNDQIYFISKDIEFVQKKVEESGFVFFPHEDQPQWENHFFQQELIRPVLESKLSRVWINDRLNTTLDHVRAVRRHFQKVVTFDDRGPGAIESDLNIAPLIFNEKLNGHRILSGFDYLGISSDFKKNSRHRKSLQRILISMGGSDNHFMTEKVLKALQLFRLKYAVEVLLGPANTQLVHLQKLFPLIQFHQAVDSFSDFLNQYDLLICAGGMTPFEAMALGMPVICCASETFEIPVAQEIEKQKLGCYMGFRDDVLQFDFSNKFAEFDLNISDYSQRALAKIDGQGLVRLVREILK